jgi:23S rRNA U2552 (ribose-2'-O)-methylase RlmE/FtsJ
MSDFLQKKYTTFFKSIDENGNSTMDERVIDIKLEYKDTDNIEFLNYEEYDKLIQVKNRIDNLDDCKLWDKTKKISNDFELIYLPNKKLKSNSVSKYEPLSRSYFKLWEIIQDFNLINNNTPIKVAGLAEGPGGFIEAVINFRKKFKNTCKIDEVYGITLKSSDKDIPGWNKAGNFLKKNPNISINYGVDGTGNIYNIDNIKAFSKLFNNDADLVTADGGFDFSTNFNKQEQTSLRIIFCEIVSALSIQKKGGTFVCKVYDTYTQVSISFLFLLHCLYETVNIIKPFTSRPANSEKYLVCTGFKGISNTLLAKLYIIVKSWEFIENNNNYIYKILDIKKIPSVFIAMVKRYNTNYFNHQVNNIEKTLNYIEVFGKDLEYETSELYKNTIKRQVTLAFKWCKKYKCKINYDSDLIDTKKTDSIDNRRKSVSNQIKVI